MITVSSERDALIIYTTALNGEIPATPTISTPTCVMEGRAITYPALANGDVLNIKAIAIAPGKAESNVTSLSYTVQPTTELQLSGIILYDKEYDGNTDAPADFSGTGLTGVIGPDSVALSGTPSASFLPKKLRVQNRKVSGYSLSGIDSEYYTLNTTWQKNQPNKKSNFPLVLSSLKINYDWREWAVISAFHRERIAGRKGISRYLAC